MNGPCNLWNLDHFYSWSEFKSMPKDIQEAYLTTISGKYRVGLSTIDREVFKHKSPTTIFNYVKKHDLKATIVKTSGTGAQIASDKLRLEIARRKLQTIDIPESKIEEAKQESAVVEEEPKTQPRSKATGATIELNGFDQEMFDWLKLIFLDKPVHITIIVTEDK